MKCGKCDGDGCGYQAYGIADAAGAEDAAGADLMRQQRQRHRHRNVKLAHFRRLRDAGELLPDLVSVSMCVCLCVCVCITCCVGQISAWLSEWAYGSERPPCLPLCAFRVRVAVVRK